MAKGIKTGGRKAGTANKLTSEIRQVLKDIVSSEIENVPDLLSKMEPDKRLDYLVKLIPYVLPKVESCSHTTNEPLQLDSW